MSTPFVGEIRLFPWTRSVKGWALCNGALLAIQQNQALFSLLGTNYGGDGVRTFALPDLMGRAATHSATPGSVGLKSGVESVTLTSAQLPGHIHPMLGVNSPGGVVPAIGHAYANIGAAANVRYAPDTGTLTTLNPATIQNTGGNLPHDNMQPFLVLNYQIALQGLFPSRN